MPTSQAVLLPNNVKPLRYAIHLTPDLYAYTFDGEETIDVEVLEATDTIVLNAAEMSISAASIMDAGNAAVDASAIELNAADETVSISFPSAIQPGPAVLRIAFTGELNDRLTGFYRSVYTRADGTFRTMATTQFEPSSARRAIPCWDEPAMKASFQLTLTVPADMDTVSNMPPTDETVDGDTKTVRFGESPVMSTYLLAFIVAELGMIEQQAENGTMVRVLTTPGKEEQGRFALETSVALLSYFNDYFGIPYPLEKLDHIAIPDFAAGAMENWGAITYRETALLVDPAISPAATRQRVAEVVSHEMAHMWFGDLVTMQWWDDLWLNESFASWMGDKAVDHIHPEWKMWTQFVANDTIRAFSLDGLKNSHPIEATVHTPAEVEELFDAISYSKGASIIRMLEHYLTPETFRDGLRRYLNANQYSNARTADLWEALEDASGKPVKSLMDTWTSQMGFPVLNVQSRHEADGVRLDVSQSRFLFSNVIEDGGERRVVVEGAAERRHFLGRRSRASMLLELEGGHCYAAPGAERRSVMVQGECRPDGLLPRQPQPARLGCPHPSGHVSRRSQTRTGWGCRTTPMRSRERGTCPRQPVPCAGGGVIARKRTPACGETSRAIWATSTRCSRTRRATRHSNRCARGCSARWPNAWAGRPNPATATWTPSCAASRWGRRVTTTTPPCWRRARRRFDAYLEDPSTLRPDLRGVVFSLTAQQGDAATYDKLWELQHSTDSQEEKVRLLISLTRIPDPELISDVLQRSLTEEVRSQDTVSVLGAGVGEPQGEGAGVGVPQGQLADLHGALRTRRVHADAAGGAASRVHHAGPAGRSARVLRVAPGARGGALRPPNDRGAGAQRGMAGAKQIRRSGLVFRTVIKS